MRNPWDRSQVLRVNLYRHKGYWYHGRNRERETMLLFADLVGAGDTVYEVGGHIGFIAQYFSKLVGQGGRVFVFEPGENNLPYLTSNVGTRGNVSIERYAVSDKSGKATFHIEDLSGQNNSLLDHYRLFEANATFAYSNDTYRDTEVDCISLDDFVDRGNPPPDFIKIDIEGAEFLALSGMTKLLKSHRPKIMVEITENGPLVEKLLNDAGYRFQDEHQQPVTSLDAFQGNLFCYPK
jgi:FkbM family methyltransferase